MIKIECTKTYTMNFTVYNEYEHKDIFELAKTYIALEEIGKSDSDVVSKIFDWLKENTRQFVPFKKVESSYPPFKIVRARNKNKEGYFFHVEWDLSKEVNEYLF